MVRKNVNTVLHCTLCVVGGTAVYVLFSKKKAPSRFRSHRPSPPAQAALIPLLSKFPSWGLLSPLQLILVSFPCAPHLFISSVLPLSGVVCPPDTQLNHNSSGSKVLVAASPSCATEAARQPPPGGSPLKERAALP